jgi:hypothetical protein
MANRWFTQFVSTLHKKPALIDCNFIVDSTNGNGYGVRSLKGAGVANVYMHTTASFTGTTHTNTTIDGIASGTSTFQIGAQLTGSGIAAGTVIVAILSSNSIQVSLATTASATVTISYFAPGSPRPATGLIYVTFEDNWTYYYGGFSGFVSPLSGTPISISTGSSLTVGNAYTIVSLGTTTAAQWQAVGVPIGTLQGNLVLGQNTLLPTIGTTFIATATSGSGTGVVEASAIAGSGVDHLEVIGDPNQTITSKSPMIFGKGSGAYMVLQAFSGGTLTAPANGTVIGMTFYFSNTVITVKGD